MADPPVHVPGRKPGTNVFRPRSDGHSGDDTFPGLLLRPEGRLFFANAERVAQKIRSMVMKARPKVVVLDLGGVFDLEHTALKTLTEAEKRNREQGVMLWLVGLNPGVLDVVKLRRWTRPLTMNGCSSAWNRWPPGSKSCRYESINIEYTMLQSR